MPLEKRLNASQSYIADSNSTLKVLTLNTGTTIQVEMFSGVDDQNFMALRERAAAGPPWIIVNTASPPGPGAIDIGGGAVALTWYYLYLLADSTGVNPTSAILSSTLDAPIGAGPAMPPGYDLTRRIASVKTDGAGAFLEVRKFGQFALYDAGLSVGAKSTQVYAGPSILGPSPVAVGAFVPPTAERCLVLVELQDPGAGLAEHVNIYGEHLGGVPIGPTFNLQAFATFPGVTQYNTAMGWVHTGGNIFIAGPGNLDPNLAIYILGYWEDGGPAV